MHWYQPKDASYLGSDLENCVQDHSHVPALVQVNSLEQTRVLYAEGLSTFQEYLDVFHLGIGIRKLVNK